jgi:multidrug efflux pump
MAIATRRVLAAAMAFAWLTSPAARAEVAVAEPMIEVEFAFAGAARDTVADRLTPLIENDLGGAPDLGFMISWSRAGQSRVVLKFKPGVRESAALERARRQADQALGRLPSGSAPPAIRAIAPERRPIAYMGFIADRFSLADVTRIVEPRVREALQVVVGVEAVRVYGARPEIGRIRLDRARLAAYGVSIEDVRAALRQRGIAAAGTEPDALTVPATADLAALGDLVLKVINGAAVRLRDVAQIERAAASDGIVARYDGAVALVVEVTRRPEIGGAEAARALAAQLPGTLMRLPGGLSHKAGFSCERCAAAVRR